jgi:hypothetical protein
VRESITWMLVLGLVIWLIVWAGQCSADACAAACGSLRPRLIYHYKSSSECTCVDSKGRIYAPKGEYP